MGAVGVKADIVCTCGTQGFDVGSRVCDHHMHISDRLRVFCFQVCNQPHRITEVWHIVPIHDINMEPAHPAVPELADILFQLQQAAVCKRGTVDQRLFHGHHSSLSPKIFCVRRSINLRSSAVVDTITYA